MLLYLLFLIINFYDVLKIIGARCIKKTFKVWFFLMVNLRGMKPLSVHFY